MLIYYNQKYPSNQIRRDGFSGVIAANRVLAIADPDSAPIGGAFRQKRPAKALDRSDAVEVE